ncbi:hypothetical protein LCGC14_2145150, partial [marine sediment metagenome]
EGRAPLFFFRRKSLIKIYALASGYSHRLPAATPDNLIDGRPEPWYHGVTQSA